MKKFLYLKARSIALITLVCMLATGCVQAESNLLKNENGGSVNEIKQENSSLPFEESICVDLIKTEYKVREEAYNRNVNITYGMPSNFVMRDAVFVHPYSDKQWMHVDYTVDLTAAKPGSLILLDYYAGFVDNAAPAGVEFGAFINDKQVSSFVTKEVKWQRQIIDVSENAGKKVKLTLGTKGAPSISSAWAGFGDPKIQVLQKVTAKIDGTNGSGTPISAKIEGQSTVKNGITGKGPLTLAVDSLDAGAYYVRIKGKSSTKFDLKVIDTNRDIPVVGSVKGNDFSYFAGMDGTVIKGDDWNAGLGLPIKDEKDRKNVDQLPANKRVLEIELDSPSEYTIDTVEFWRASGSLTVKEAGSGSYKCFDSKDVTVNTLLSNGAGGPVLKKDGVKLRLAYTGVDGKVTNLEDQNVPELSVGSEKLFSWNAGKLSAGTYAFKLYQLVGTQSKELKSFDLNVEAFDPKNKEKAHVIENEKLRLVCRTLGTEVNEGYLYKKSGDKLLGTVPVPKINIGQKDIPLVGLALKNSTKDSLTLEKTLSTGTVTVEWKLEGSALKMKNSYLAKSENEIYSFEGPMFLAGDGSFGRAKNSAIFSGIEYLAYEDSNNDLSARKPYSDRWAPNPKKVTLPVMSIAQGGDVLVYSWEPDKEWAEGKKLPTPRFEAPSLHGGNYSVMGTFAPSSTLNMEENSLTAFNPFILETGETIVLEAKIDVIAGDKAINGVYDYVKKMKLPAPPQTDKKPLDVINLLLKGHENEILGPNGWIGFIGLEKTPSVNLESVHNLISAQFMLGKNESVRAAKLVNSLNMPPVIFDWSYHDSVWFRMEKDYMDAYYNSCEQITNSTVSLQDKEGMWSYMPSSPKDKQFGKAGDKTMGTVSVPLIKLVKAARMTGNDSYWKAALKGLTALSTFTKPAGAGPWELPNTNPDELAAYLSLKACIDAYEYKPSPALLKQCIETAKMSLPFIYFTPVSGKRVSLYTTIPSLGATNWMRPWQGSPVQWQGMLLSVEFQRLSKYDKSIDWAKISQGMLNAGINLVNQKNQPGRFPDYLDMHKSDAVIYNIWANLVGRAVQDKLGYPTSWDEVHDTKVKLIAGYDINGFKNIAQKLEFSVSVPKGMPCYITIRGKEIKGLTVNGKKLVKKDLLDQADSGFRKSEAVQGYVIKVRGETKPLNIQVQ